MCAGGVSVGWGCSRVVGVIIIIRFGCSCGCWLGDSSFGTIIVIVVAIASTTHPLHPTPHSIPAQYHHYHYS